VTVSSTSGQSVIVRVTVPAGTSPGNYQGRVKYQMSVGAANANFDFCVTVPSIAGTTTSLVSSSNPSTYGSSVTFTANVSPSPAGAGTVTFKDGSTTICSNVALAGDTATCSTSTLSKVGSPHSITAAYSGATGFSASTSSSLSQTVSPKALSITAANQTKTYGDTLTFDETSPSADFSVVGLVNGDTVTSVSLASAGAAASATVALSPYAITPSAAVGTGLGNYTISYLNGKLFVLYSTASCLGSPGHQILQPINANPNVDLSVFKQGSTVPAKFRVCDANGNSIGTAGVVSSFRLTSLTTLSESQIIDETVVSTTPDTAFRWSSTDQQWIYNISTKNLTAKKTYGYTIALDDGSKIQFQFGLK
jgi:hypothetical protein